MAKPEGLSNWTNYLMQQGNSIQSAIVGLCDSIEYKTKHPIPTEFVKSLYYRILERDLDPAVVNDPCKTLTEKINPLYEQLDELQTKLENARLSPAQRRQIQQQIAATNNQIAQIEPQYKQCIATYSHILGYAIYVGERSALETKNIVKSISLLMIIIVAASISLPCVLLG